MDPLAGIIIVPLVLLALVVVQKWLRKWRERRLIRQAFSRYISPETVERLLNEPEDQLFGGENQAVDWILLQVRDSSLEHIKANLDRAITLTFESRGLVETIFQSFVFVSFGALPADRGYPSDARSRLVERLLAGMGPEIRLVHGCAACFVGSIGGSTRFSFGSLVPEFGDALGTLLNLQFGTAAEAKPAQVSWQVEPKTHPSTSSG